MQLPGRALNMPPRRKDKGAQSYPIDPDDLQRRLCAVLAERKAEEAAAKRLSRGLMPVDAVSTSPAIHTHDKYRPKSAQLDGPPPLRQDDVRRVSRAVSAQPEPPSFQSPHHGFPEPTTTRLARPFTGTFETAQSSMTGGSDNNTLWRSRTQGTLLLDKPATSDGVLLGNPTEYRVDWSHGDETRRSNSPPKSASFRKGDFWGLGGKFGWNKASRREHGGTVTRAQTQRTSFFSRFRR